MLQDTTNAVNQLDTERRRLPGTRKAKARNSNKGNKGGKCNGARIFSGDSMSRLYPRHLMPTKKQQENFNLKMIKGATLLKLIKAFMC